MSRNKNYIKLINSTVWKQLRYDMLVQHPLCQMCEAEGRERFATEVHHVKPIESIDDAAVQQSLAYDKDNLLCLCHDCHVQAHRRLMSHAGQFNRNKKQEIQSAIEKLFGDDPGGSF